MIKQQKKGMIKFRTAISSDGGGQGYRTKGVAEISWSGQQAQECSFY